MMYSFPGPLVTVHEILFAFAQGKKTCLVFSSFIIRTIITFSKGVKCTYALQKSLLLVQDPRGEIYFKSAYQFTSV